MNIHILIRAAFNYIIILLWVKGMRGWVKGVDDSLGPFKSDQKRGYCTYTKTNTSLATGRKNRCGPSWLTTSWRTVQDWARQILQHTSAVFSVATGTSPSHTHTSVISREMLWGGSLTMWHCPGGFMTRFQQMTFYPICFPLGGLISFCTGSWGIFGNTCFQMAFLLHLQRCWALLSALDWHCAGRVLGMECCLREVLGGWQWKGSWAAAICGRERFIITFAPAELCLQLSMGWNNTVKIWRKKKRILYVSQG